MNSKCKMALHDLNTACETLPGFLLLRTGQLSSSLILFFHSLLQILTELLSTLSGAYTWSGK